MSDTPAKPAEQPANLLALHQELVNLATRVKQTPLDDRIHQAQSPLLLIRGK